MLTQTDPETNKLYPVFLKLENLRLLLVGGGNVALEKLQSVLGNSPATAVTIVAPMVRDELRSFISDYPNCCLIERNYEAADLEDKDIVICATDNPELHAEIRLQAAEKHLLVNVADTPALCDFYLGSIVKKGNLKIAISTNGKSPTIAKRIKNELNEYIPNEIDDVLTNMEQIRKGMNGSFADKVEKLNKLTEVLAEQQPAQEPELRKKSRVGQVIGYLAIALLFMVLGQVLFPYLTIYNVFEDSRALIINLDSQFYSMLFTGFAAQLFSSALGMGYGVICTTILLSFGINLPAISGSIHTAETFSMGVAGYSHYKVGNVNKKLFRALLLPGIIGAVLGAWMLAHFGNEYARYIKPVLAIYTLLLGLRILSNAFRKRKIRRSKIRNIPMLAATGGFIDSFGGGGWGPLVTSTMIAKGKTPRYVIGTSDLGKFFVTLASALTFFAFLGVSHWQIVAGLLIGGVCAAPLGARLAGILPNKAMYVSVGILVILCSLRIFFQSIGSF